jgi:hypothetical protein
MSRTEVREGRALGRASLNEPNSSEPTSNEGNPEENMICPV